MPRDCKQRLGVVSGEQAQATDEKEASVSNAARIRAARQRRYGRKDVEHVAIVEDSNEKDISKPVASTERSELTQAVQSQLPSGTKESFEVEKEDANQEDPQGNRKNPTINDEFCMEPSVDSITESRKKYLGVARMRRQMIKKKKMEGDKLEVLGDSFGDSFALEGRIEPTVSSPNPPIPIYMHILTIFLLFFAGVDLSYQHDHRKLKVSSELGIQKDGITLIHHSLSYPSRGQMSASSILRNFQVPPDINQPSNEFQDGDVQDPPHNLDPLFRVDLDELTKGPGVMKVLARGAVSVHRSIVWLVCLIPVSIVQAALRIPQALLRSPPTLCLVALAVRHILGKAILGAGIPEPIKEMEKGPIDLVALAKNFVMNFLTANFPTVVGVYEAFTHLRTDMYVLLCGTFSGFVWLHLHSMHPVLDIVHERPSYEEL